MPLLSRITSALGLGGLSAAQTVTRSPWSDSSHLESVSFDMQFGIGAHGKVSRDAAISIATVADVRDVLTGRVSRCPLTEYGQDGQPWTRPRRLFSQPENGRPRSQTITWTLDELLFHGRAFFQITERDADNFPARLVLVKDQHAETNSDGQMIRAHGKDVRPVDSLRIDGPHEGVLVRGADTIRRAVRLNRAAAKAENNPVPSLDLHNNGEDLTDEEITKLTASWHRARETSGVGYSSKSMEVKTLGQPAEQLMIDGRKAITLELLRHMGAGATPEIAAAAADGASSLNYSNRASREAALIDNFLSPYMTAIEDRLSMDDLCPRGHYVKFDTDVLTREDTATRYRNYKLAKELELMGTDDIRRAEGKKVDS